MDSHAASKRHFRNGVCAIVSYVALSFCINAFGQEGRTLLLPAPPPMKFVSRDDRAELTAAKDAKTRIRVGLELAESRLHRAEQMTIAKQYDGAAGELGSYQGIIEDALRYLTEKQNGSARVRDLYRRVELALRSAAPRLELIRRSTPLEYAVHVKAIADYARTARAEALNSFYGDTVFRGESFREEPKALGGERASGALPAQQAQQTQQGQQGKQP